ncbi:hypothetical protein GCM10023158_04990 [Gluconacetobacter tumulicola]
MQHLIRAGYHLGSNRMEQMAPLHEQGATADSEKKSQQTDEEEFRRGTPGGRFRSHGSPLFVSGRGFGYAAGCSFAHMQVAPRG